MYLIDQRVAMIAGKENEELRTIASRNSWMLIEPGPIETMAEQTARRRVQVVVVHVASTDDTGLELIRKFSAHWRPPYCLVVALISRASLEQAALAAGANCYLTDPKQIESAVCTYLDVQDAKERRIQTGSNVSASRRVSRESLDRWKNPQPVVVEKNLRS